MKYRIKVVKYVRYGDAPQFLPQCKKFLFWNMVPDTYLCNTLQGAKNLIDKYIVESKEKKHKTKEIKKLPKYIKYP